jgi:hypothetical protein
MAARCVPSASRFICLCTCVSAYGPPTCPAPGPGPGPCLPLPLATPCTLLASVSHRLPSRVHCLFVPACHAGVLPAKAHEPRPCRTLVSAVLQSTLGAHRPRCSAHATRKCLIRYVSDTRPLPCTCKLPHQSLSMIYRLLLPRRSVPDEIIFGTGRRGNKNCCRWPTFWRDDGIYGGASFRRYSANTSQFPTGRENSDRARHIIPVRASRVLGPVSKNRCCALYRGFTDR